MTQALNDNVGHIDLNIVRGVYYSILATDITDYDCTLYTWVGTVIHTGSRETVFTFTVTAASSISLIPVVTTAQTLLLESDGDYSYFIVGTLISDTTKNKCPLMGKLKAKELGGA